MSSTTPKTLTGEQICRQTLGILNANCHHFFIISILFFPFTFSISTTLQSFFTSFFHKTIITHPETLISLQTLISSLTFTFFIIFPTVAGIAVVTHSTSHVINGKQPSLTLTFKSLSHSYIPLLSTILAGVIKLSLLSFATIAVTKAMNSLGLGFYSDLVYAIVSCIVVITVLFFIVIWGPAASIAVLESKSGFEPLTKSAKQSAQFQKYSFWILFINGFVVGFSIAFYAVSQTIGSTTIRWLTILQVCNLYPMSSIWITQYVAANTVLYVQYRGEVIDCKT